MACRHIRNTLKVIIHDFKIFANLAHANEIQACYDCANNTRTVPGLQSIISALIYMSSSTNSVDLQKATKFF